MPKNRGKEWNLKENKEDEHTHYKQINENGKYVYQNDNYNHNDIESQQLANDSH